MANNMLIKFELDKKTYNETLRKVKRLKRLADSIRVGYNVALLLFFFILGIFYGIALTLIIQIILKG